MAEDIQDSDRMPEGLLPNGLADLLPPYAEKEAGTVALFMAEFAAFGYERVKPPLVEFEESLLGEGPGRMLARNTFRVMDPVSRHMMGVRADVTAQIARIASTRLSDAPRPLRLSYAADVLRVNGTQLRPERQFCQTGCEMIGRDSVQADVEMPLVALKALSAGGIDNLSVDLTVPSLIDRLYEEAGVPAPLRSAIDDAIAKRDRDALSDQGSAVAAILRTIMDAGREGRGPINLPGVAGRMMARVHAVADELRGALDAYGLQRVSVTIDPFERRGFDYQTGVSFTIFAKGARGELGRGGRYDVQSGGGAETASGFTLYMDTILRAAPTAPSPTIEKVSEATSWSDIGAMQSRGLRVARG